MTYIPYLGEVLHILRPNAEWSIDTVGDVQTVEYASTNALPYPEEAELLAKSAEIPEILNWRDLRRKRDRLLAETDWWANSDVTMTDEQRIYRQALRDLPANTEDPANPVWPTKPE